MPKVLVDYVKFINLFNTRVGKIIEYGIFVMLALMLIETFSRTVLNSPTEWSLELGRYVLGAYFTIGSGYILLCERHVRMDALYSRWSARRRAAFDLATFSVGIIFLIVLLRGSIDAAHYAMRFNQHSSSAWAPPLVPIKIIFVFGISLLLLQMIALFIKDLSIVKGKPIP